MCLKSGCKITKSPSVLWHSWQVSLQLCIDNMKQKGLLAQHDANTREQEVERRADLSAIGCFLVNEWFKSHWGLRDSRVHFVNLKKFLINVSQWSAVIRTSAGIACRRTISDSFTQFHHLISDLAFWNKINFLGYLINQKQVIAVGANADRHNGMCALCDRPGLPRSHFLTIPLTQWFHSSFH